MILIIKFDLIIIYLNNRIRFYYLNKTWARFWLGLFALSYHIYRYDKPGEVSSFTSEQKLYLAAYLFRKHISSSSCG
jgi:hypothetical protein